MTRDADTPGGILGFGLGRVPQHEEKHEWRGDHSGPTPPDTLEQDAVVCRIEFRGGGTQCNVKSCQ